VWDLSASRRFYTTALAPLGFELVYDGPEPVHGVHVAFDAADHAMVDAFHAAALEAGGHDNGAPGLRPYGVNYNAAFVLDPDQYRVELIDRSGK
jgi:hypothetical protein